MYIEDSFWNNPEAIIQADEDTDKKEMVKKNLIKPAEVEGFDYSKEFQIPEALMTQPPKVTERMQQQITDKFPTNLFEKGQLAGRLIHGTFIHAIKPIWLALNQNRTSYQGKGTSEKRGDHTMIGSPKKGFFSISGDVSRLGEDGFNQINNMYEKEHRMLACFDLPIIIVMSEEASTHGRDPADPYKIDTKSWKHEVETTEDYQKYRLNRLISAVVLTKPESLIYSDNNKQGASEKYLVAGKNSKLRITIQQEKNYIAHCMTQGVDKSKIVPIYDWDGKLLWPTEADVIKKEESKK